MIPQEPEQIIETSGNGVKLVANFRITDETMPRLLVDLSDKMYNQKELAVIREYSTNAADAVVKAGRLLSNILVTLPTTEDLTFRIRDFGEGLTEEKISDVYCVLGASDKRNTNLYNGMFGYGCKAGFAAADSFIVTSWCNGEKSVYQCVKGDTKKPHSAFLLNRVSSNEPSGIEISVPVRPSSMWTFHQMAAQFYQYWETLPTINNLDVSYSEPMLKYRKSEPTLKGDRWEVRAGNGNPRGVAYMGYVAYPIDWNIMYTKMPLNQQSRALFELLRANNVVLFFNIGEVTFVNNREGLEYTEETIKVLSDRIQEIFAKIKDSIQVKFDPLPNLWEAKKMYNSIFGTGTVDMENGEHEDVSERVRILDGNLMKLEQTFQGVFKWNGIVIGSPYFRHINRFDNNLTDIGNEDHTPSSPVMVTYRKKKLRVKVGRCEDGKNNGITASNNVAVVLNDLGVRSGVQQVARYLIFKPNSRIKVVHFLRFDSEGLKSRFYKTYDFDTVPVLKLSELIGPAKTWVNANKVSRSYGGGGSGARVMRYIDVENECIKESEVPIREMEDGGYFIKVSDYRKKVLLADNSTTNPDNICSDLKVVADKLGIELDRVYIISKQTSEAKWFNQAVESGDWICVWDYLKENLTTIDAVTLLDAVNYDNHAIIGNKTAKKIKNKVYSKDSIISKFIDTVVSQDFENNVLIANALQSLCLWESVTKNVSCSRNFEKESHTVYKTYPLLSEFHRLQYDGVDNDELVNIINYINAMDAWLELNLAPLVTKKELA